MADVLQLLRDVEMFQGLQDKQLRRLAALFETERLEKDEVLFCQGDAGDAIYLVMEGSLAVVVDACVAGSEGRVVVLLGRGQSVGEMTLVDQGERSASVKAATNDTVVLSASSGALNQLLDRCPKLGYGIMRNIAADLSFRLRSHDQEG